MVYSAFFRGKNYALKSLNINLSLGNKEFKRIKRELKSFYAISHPISHPNIVKFHGISRDPRTGHFMLVLQFANGGCLRNYLQGKRKDRHYKISWNELIQISKDITDGLICLHKNDIIHRDLHSKNILLNDGKALIADFGISKQLNDTTDSSSSSNLKGTIPYTDPRCLLQNIQQDKESNIYSLGMLLWELTSGIPPFSELNLNISRLIIHISENKKVEIIDQTPPDYARLFEKCWSSDLNQRPILSEILKELEKLSVNAPVDFISNNININNQPTAQSEQSYSESFESLDNYAKNLNADKNLDENQDESNDDTHQKNNMHNDSSKDNDLILIPKYDNLNVNKHLYGNNLTNDLNKDNCELICISSISKCDNADKTTYDKSNNDTHQEKDTTSDSNNNEQLIIHGCNNEDKRLEDESNDNTHFISRCNDSGMTLTHFGQIVSQLTQQLPWQNISVIDHRMIEEKILIKKPCYGTIMEGHLKQTVMMKYIPKELITNNKEKFEELIQNLAKIKHPNVQQFLGISKDSDVNSNLILMENIENGTLYDYISENEYIGWDRIAKILKYIAHGLRYIHNMGIIHRNLHVRTILIDKEKVQISNPIFFELLNSKEFATASSDTNPDRKSLTQASNIYAFGVIMWTVSSGRLPSENSSSSRDLITNIRENLVINTPEAYLDLYQRCCEQNSKNRPTIQEICDQFDNMSQERQSNSFELQIGNVNSISFSEIKNKKLTKCIGYGVVQKGHWRDHLVIMKDISPELMINNNETLKQILHVLSIVKHPNILRFIGTSADYNSI